jgi:hypothetical protein
MKTIAPSSTVQESDNTFLQLFPHRFDFIYAEHPQPGDSPQWRTESRYPLSDRVLQQGAYLFGVRFSIQTCYAVLDVDRGSAYHPQHDPFAISRMIAALEPIGLVTAVICTSSYSGGLHLYFPFEESQASWEMGLAIATLLQNAGFVLKPGQLEVFPNPRPYQPESKPSLFSAHRLPLQIGSYLVDEFYQPIWSDQQRFVQQWQLAQSRNSVTQLVIKRVIKQARRKQYEISGKADQFLNDLNTEIELGWTGYGQTNRLLGRIALRSYVFHHVLHEGQPLEGESLVDEIVRIARSLPGYEDWCQHQHEIEQRAQEWARCVEASHYFPYGRSHGKYQSKTEISVSSHVSSVSWNQKQSEATREKIRQAIADLLETNSLPVGITARFQALTRYGIGGGSLYRHRDLWHPNYLYPGDPDFSAEASIDPGFSPLEKVPDQPVENPPNPPTSLEDSSRDSVEGASREPYPTSLFPHLAGNPLSYLPFPDVAPAMEISTACKPDSPPAKIAALLVGPSEVAAIAAQTNSVESAQSLADLSDLLAEISALIHQLNWSRQFVQDCLQQLFGQRQTALLSATELLIWRQWLHQQAKRYDPRIVTN